MKNISEENSIKQKGQIFPQKESKKSNIVNSEKNKEIIITESSEIKNTFKNKNKIQNLFSTRIQIILTIIYFLIIIGSETLYRDYLFKKSITIQENIQKNEKNKTILKFCRIISMFGGEISTLFIFAIIFLILPLNYSFLILLAIVYPSYFTNTFKMIYQADRPNWHSDLLTFSCNYGYGNPSGHSFTSVSLYLTLSHILVTYLKINNIIFRLLIFTCFIYLSLFIIVSRVILAAHSINQVIYGTTLGLGLYYILIYLIGYHKYSTVDFLRHIRSKKINYIFYITNISLLVLTILVYFIINSKDTTLFEQNIFNGVRCKIKNKYLKYKNDGLFQSLSITCLIGAQLGINMLFKILKKQNYLISVSIIEWNKYKNIKIFFLRLLIVGISSLGILLYYIIPKNSPLLLIYIFKSGLAFFLGMFGIHFLGIYLCIYLKISNSDIYKIDVLHEITGTD